MKTNIDRKKTNLLVVAATALFASTALAGGKGAGAGNGGMAYVCYGPTKTDGTRVIRSAQLVDYWEARQGAYRLTIDLGKDNPGKDDSDAMIENALSRLSRIDAERAQDYRERLGKFAKDQAVVSGAAIERTFDAHLLLRPGRAGCEITQLVYQVKDPAPRQVKFLIDGEIYGKLFDTDRAGIRLHEAIYWREIELGAQNSDGTRNINRFISSKEFEGLGIQEAQMELAQLSLWDSVVELAGQNVRLKSISEEDGVFSGTIAQPTLSRGAIDFGGPKDVICRERVSYDRERGIVSCSNKNPAAKTEVILSPGTVLRVPETIRFGTSFTKLGGDVYDESSRMFPLKGHPEETVRFIGSPGNEGSRPTDFTTILDSDGSVEQIGLWQAIELRSPGFEGTFYPSGNRYSLWEIPARFRTQFGVLNLVHAQEVSLSPDGGVAATRITKEAMGGIKEWLSGDERLRSVLPALERGERNSYSGYLPLIDTFFFREDGTVAAIRFGSGESGKFEIGGKSFRWKDFKTVIVNFDEAGNVIDQ